MDAEWALIPDQGRLCVHWVRQSDPAGMSAPACPEGDAARSLPSSRNGH
jgi:hypothetical protein